jgi:hypothetical protein
MSKPNGRWRGKADSVHGPSRPHYLIGSASATFMMSSGTPRACCPSGRIHGCSRCPLRVHSVRIKRARKGSPYMEITPLLCIYGPLEMGAAPMTLSVRSRRRCWLASRSCVMDTGLRPVSYEPQNAAPRHEAVLAAFRNAHQPESRSSTRV